MPYKNPEAQRAAQRRSYLRNKERNRERNRERLREYNRAYVDRNLQRLRRVKEESPCTDCGVSYPYYVMDFDHLRDKKFGLNRASVPRGWNAIQAEIDKCELVCANCHRQRTHSRLQTVT